MNQDQLLERFWTDVIDAVEDAAVFDAATHGAIDLVDVQWVARRARYAAVFDWCCAFDEEGLSVAEWLARDAADPAWRGLVAYRATALAKAPRAPRPDEPFADAAHAEARLRGAKVTPRELAALMEREGLAALVGVRTLLAQHAFDAGDLEGLHESVLSADPSGLEGRPGSWPRRARRRQSPARRTSTKAEAAPEPLVRVRKSHALALSPDALRVVAARGGAITDIATGETVVTCALLANTGHIVWSPTGRWIAAATTSGQIALCDASSGERRRVLRRGAEGPAPVFAADGATLYAGDWSGELYAWDVETGSEVARNRIDEAMIRHVERTAGGDLVVLVSHRPEPTELVRVSASLEASARRVRLAEHVEDIVLDPRHEERALAGGRDWIGRLDLESGAIEDRHALAVRHLALSPDAHWCAVTTKTGFRFGESSDLASGVELERQYASGRAAFSAGSRRVALATWNAGEVWDVETLARAHGASARDEGAPSSARPGRRGGGPP